jgi:ABC transport system ATP-binding/permease protein
MIILRAEGLSKQIQGQLLFQQVDLNIELGDRIGIIGVNGCGKSTLMKCLTGQQELDLGTVKIAQGYRLAYLGQSPQVSGELSVREAVYQGQTELLECYQRYLDMCDLAATGDERAFAEMDKLTDRLDREGFFSLQLRADVAIERLGLTMHLADHAGKTRTVEQLSGGQRRRVDLAAILTSEPDILLLDEPTNHLDTESVEWLEAFLRDYRGAVIMVTHDRYFLDRITNRTLELDNQTTTLFQGNYASYLEKKSEMQQQAESTAAKRANLWRRELEWLRRGPKARTTKSKSRIERAMDLKPDQKQEKIELEFQFASARLGSKVIVAEGVGKSFGERNVIENLEFIVEPGARIGIIGPNGSGKTTLLDMFAGRTQPSTGNIETGTTVKIGYFDQENRELPEKLKVLDALREVAESIPLSNGQVLTASQMLDRFLFSGRLQHTLVGRLSGGEKRRLLLLQILMTNPNVLLLDEPTNDLDIPTLSCLEQFLDCFSGSLLVSSHDRYFLDRNVETLLAFEGSSTPIVFTGSYSDYLENRNRAKSKPAAPVAAKVAPATSQAAPSGNGNKKATFKQRKDFEELESQIPVLEGKKKQLESEMAENGIAYADLTKKTKELQNLQKRLNQALERWTELAELIES